MNEHILIVDDEPNVRLSYRITLETEGYIVREASGAAEALAALIGQSFRLAILDLRMPEKDGLELLAEMRQLGIDVPVVIITAYGDVPNAVRAMKLGAIDFLAKPLTPQALRELVEEVSDRHAAPKKTPEPAKEDFETHFSEAKRFINLRKFDVAWKHLGRAMELHPHSPEPLNLAGVLFEMQEDYERARKLYGKAIKYGPAYEPAQQNMRRIFELFRFGSSKEPFALGDD